MRRWLWVMGLVPVSVGCGADESVADAPHVAPEDAGVVTEQPSWPGVGPGGVDRPSAASEPFDVGGSRSAEALGDEATQRGLCAATVLLAHSDGQIDALACEALLTQCRTGDVPSDFDPEQFADLQIPNDPPLGSCPATADQVDACVAELLVLTSDLFADSSCEEPAPRALAGSDLLGATGCATLFLLCPDLVQPLLDAVTAQ